MKNEAAGPIRNWKNIRFRNWKLSNFTGKVWGSWENCQCGSPTKMTVKRYCSLSGNWRHKIPYFPWLIIVSLVYRFHPAFWKSCRMVWLHTAYRFLQGHLRRNLRSVQKHRSDNPCGTCSRCSSLLLKDAGHQGSCWTGNLQQRSKIQRKVQLLFPEEPAEKILSSHRKNTIQPMRLLKHDYLR